MSRELRALIEKLRKSADEYEKAAEDAKLVERDQRWYEGGATARNEDADLLEAALAAAEDAPHEPKLYMADGPITGHEGKSTVASVGCVCGWNSDGKSYNKEGDWAAHMAAQPPQAPQEPYCEACDTHHSRAITCGQAAPKEPGR